MPQHKHARESALQKARVAAHYNRAQLTRALAHYAPPRRAEKILNLISSRFDVSNFAPLSNFATRMQTAMVLVDLLLRQYDRVRHDRSVRHFLFTGTWDDGITFEHAPEVSFARLELKARRLLKSLGLDAICVFEVDVLSKVLSGDPSRLLLFHVHAVCWTRDSGFAPVKVGRELSALLQYHNQLGVPGVTFVSRDMSAYRRRPAVGPDDVMLPDDPRFRDLKLRDQNAWSMADLARYMTKAATFAKDRYQAADGSWRVCRDEQAFGLNTALRFAEIWSHITPADAVFGVGAEGGALAREISRRMRRYVAHQNGVRKPVLQREQVARAWQQLFEAHPRLGFQPSIVTHRAM